MAPKSSQSAMGETVVVSDCRFTLLEPSVVVVPVSKAELMSSTVLEAALAVLAFSVAAACASLASEIAALASTILSSGSGPSVVVSGVVSSGVLSGGAVVVSGPVGPVVASHSSSMVAAPDVTFLKQYSLLSGVPSLQYQCRQGPKCITEKHSYLV